MLLRLVSFYKLLHNDICLSGSGERRLKIWRIDIVNDKTLFVLSFTAPDFGR